MRAWRKMCVLKFHRQPDCSCWHRSCVGEASRTVTGRATVLLESRCWFRSELRCRHAQPSVEQATHVMPCRGVSALPSTLLVVLAVLSSSVAAPLPPHVHGHHDLHGRDHEDK